MSKKFDDYISKFKPFEASKLPCANPDKDDFPELNAVKHFVNEELSDDWAAMGSMTLCTMLMLNGVVSKDGDKQKQFRVQLKSLLDYLSERVAGLILKDDKSSSSDTMSPKEVAVKAAAECDIEADRLAEPFAAGLDKNDFLAVMSRAHIRTIMRKLYSVELGLVALKYTIRNMGPISEELRAKIHYTIAENFAQQLMHWSHMEAMLSQVFKLPAIDSLVDLIDRSKKRYEHLLGEGLKPEPALTEALTMAGKFLAEKVAKARQHVEHENDADSDGKTFDFGVGLN